MCACISLFYQAGEAQRALVSAAARLPSGPRRLSHLISDAGLSGVGGGVVTEAIGAANVNLSEPYHFQVVPGNGIVTIVPKPGTSGGLFARRAAMDLLQPAASSGMRPMDASVYTGTFALDGSALRQLVRLDTAYPLSRGARVLLARNVLTTADLAAGLGDSDDDDNDDDASILDTPIDLVFPEHPGALAMHGQGAGLSRRARSQRLSLTSQLTVELAVPKPPASRANNASRGSGCCGSNERSETRQGASATGLPEATNALHESTVVSTRSLSNAFSDTARAIVAGSFGALVPTVEARRAYADRELLALFEEMECAHAVEIRKHTLLRRQVFELLDRNASMGDEFLRAVKLVDSKCKVVLRHVVRVGAPFPNSLVTLKMVYQTFQTTAPSALAATGRLVQAPDYRDHRGDGELGRVAYLEKRMMKACVQLMFMATHRSQRVNINWRRLFTAYSMAQKRKRKDDNESRKLGLGASTNALKAMMRTHHRLVISSLAADHAAHPAQLRIVFADNWSMPSMNAEGTGGGHRSLDMVIMGYYLLSSQHLDKSDLKGSWLHIDPPGSHLYHKCFAELSPLSPAVNQLGFSIRLPRTIEIELRGIHAKSKTKLVLVNGTDTFVEVEDNSDVWLTAPEMFRVEESARCPYEPATKTEAEQLASVMNYTWLRILRAGAVSWSSVRGLPDKRSLPYVQQDHQY